MTYLFDAGRRYLRNAGFTLIETMTFALLVAVVLGASIPVLDSVYTAIKLRTAAEALVNELQMAKMKAVNDNTSVTVSLNTSTKTYQISGLNTRYLDNTVSFSGTPPANITFTSRGRLSTGSTQTITLQGRNGRTNTITINANGRIAIS